MDKYLRVKIEKQENGTIKINQPYLITQILETLGYNERTKAKNMPEIFSKILHKDKEDKEIQTQWEYANFIGQLNFLEKSTRPDIAYAVHQCMRFTSDPRESHKQAVLRIGRYLMATKDEGIIFSIKKVKTCYYGVMQIFVATGGWKRCTWTSQQQNQGQGM